MTAGSETAYFAPRGRRPLDHRDGLVLLLDGGNPCLRSGLMRKGQILGLAAEESSAEEGLWKLVATCLGKTSPLEVETFLYQAGPGSLLGLRIAAMLVESWRAWQRLEGREPAKLRFYHHAEGVAAALKSRLRGEAFSLGSDARRKSWNVLVVDAVGQTSWKLLSSEEWVALPGRRYLLPQGFCSQPIPEGTGVLEERLGWWDFGLLWEDALTGELGKAEPALLRSSKFVPWSGQIHRGSRGSGVGGQRS
ncbi:MAG: hypothetical protein JJT75_06105 [Opitutales bacterium]|nr:hypothetical protein [Opitutales bacterium]MCH8540147.1 hypothetical protein [Opitutales bacterium]